MHKMRLISAPLAICAAMMIPATLARAYTGRDYAREARITLDDARTLALKAYPGTIIDQELEKEEGGSGLRYSFDIRQGGAVREVGIDAKTGAILENSAEGPHAD